MMKTIAMAGVIAVALVAGTTAASVGLSKMGFDVSRLQVAPPQTMTVVGHGKQDETNRIARFNASVSATGDGKETVNAEMEEAVTKLIEAAKEFGIEEKNIQTQYFNIYQEEMTDFQNNTPTVKKGPWRGNTSVSFSDVPVDKSEDFSRLLVQSGATSIDGPSFGIEDIESIEDELLTAAIANAKEKASSIAEAEGLRLGKILAITESGSDSVVPFFRMGMGGGAADSALAPGSSEVSKTVSVTFEMR